MPWTHAGSVAVIAAHQFNPSIVNTLWLVRHGVLAEEDFQEGSLYSDMIAQVRSRHFHMLVLQEQLQFVPAGLAEEHQRLIIDKLGTIVRTLPHTPYRALGLNFSWHLVPADGNIGRILGHLRNYPTWLHPVIFQPHCQQAPQEPFRSFGFIG